MFFFFNFVCKLQVKDVYYVCSQSNTATTITVKLTTPEEPNGIIRLYSVLIDGTVVSRVRGRVGSEREGERERERKGERER